MTRRCTAAGSVRSQLPCPMMNESTIRASQSAAAAAVIPSRELDPGEERLDVGRQGLEDQGAGGAEVGQQPLGLGVEHLLQDLVLEHGPVGEEQAALESLGGPGSVVDLTGQAAEEGGDLERDRLRQQLVAPALEVAVHGGAADIGLAGDVFERRLREPVAAHAHDGRAEDAGADVVGHGDPA